MKYKKVSEDDVLMCLIHHSVNILDGWFAYPSSVIAECLQTSMYQVRKYLKSLKEKGLVCIVYNEIQKNFYVVEGWMITEKCKELEAYKRADAEAEKMYQKMLKGEL